MFTIYHNPRCSKSRQTLALLEDAKVDISIIEYLKESLTVAQIKTLLTQLGFDDPRQLMRTKEAIYKELNLKTELNADALIQAMIENPKLIERPIVVSNEKAVLGRPPENVQSLLP